MRYNVETEDDIHTVYDCNKFPMALVCSCNQYSNAECIAAILNEDLNERNAFSISILNGLKQY